MKGGRTPPLSVSWPLSWVDAGSSGLATGLSVPADSTDDGNGVASTVMSRGLSYHSALR